MVDAPPPTTQGASEADASRLRLLQQLHLPGGAGEPGFDEIVHLASLLTGAPAAAITFVDADREWCAASIGWTLSEVPRADSLGARAIEVGGELDIDDATWDPWWSAHPLVVGEPHVRSYIGIPLRPRVGAPGADGHHHAVGTLCVLDTGPHRRTPAERDALRVLARQTERVLEARWHAIENERLRSARALMHARFDVVTSSMRCGIVVFSRDAAIEWANVAAEEVLGLTVDQMRGITPVDPVWRCVHADGTPFPGEHHPVSVTLREGRDMRDVVMGVVGGGSTLRWILVNSSALRDGAGRLDGAVATFVDITHEIVLRDRLARSLDRLRQNTHEQAALTAAITHGLATPAAAMRIVADVAVDTSDDEARRSALDALRTNAHRIEQLVADLAQLAPRLRDAPDPTRVRTDVVRIVRRACAASGIDVVVPGSAADVIEADVDDVQIERIVDNLLDNAAKYAPGPEPAVVTVDADDRSVVLAVEDRGPGVAEQHRERVFEPFARLDPDPTTSGSGIGLYLVRQFARFHEGDAWCEPGSAGGSRFVVRIARWADPPRSG